MPTKIETRGRKPLPLDKKKAPQSTLKINNFILPFVQELKGNLKKGMVSDKTLSGLFSVLNGTEQQCSIFNDPSVVSIIEELQEKIIGLDAKNLILENKLARQQEMGLKLVQERDKEHLKSVHTESKINSLRSSYRLLKNDHEALLHREHNCMVIKRNGERCSKTAKLDVHQKGIMIHVCLQHAKLAESYLS